MRTRNTSATCARQVHRASDLVLLFAYLRIFDRFECNLEKGHPLHLRRVKLPKRPLGLYESTVLDTTDSKIRVHKWLADASVT